MQAGILGRDLRRVAQRRHRRFCVALLVQGVGQANPCRSKGGVERQGGGERSLRPFMVTLAVQAVPKLDALGDLEPPRQVPGRLARQAR